MIPVKKLLTEGNSANEVYNRENASNSAYAIMSESKIKSIIKFPNKEKQRSLSNKNQNTNKSKNNKEDQTHQIILTEENSEGIKDTAKIDDVYILNKFFKFINLASYPYNRPIAKKIKIIFRVFWENRTEFLLHNKSSNNYVDVKDDEDFDLAEESRGPIYALRKNISKEKFTNKVYYERFKRRVMSQLENEMTFKPEMNTSENQSHINTAVCNKRKKLKMEDAYEYQKKKKER